MRFINLCVKWNTKRFNIFVLFILLFFDYFCNDFIVDLFTKNKEIIIIIIIIIIIRQWWWSLTNDQQQQQQQQQQNKNKKQKEKEKATNYNTKYT